jgi:hypothetical protein
MQRDVINGYETLIFEESQIDLALEAAKTHSSVVVSCPCSVCGQPVQATVQQYLEDSEVQHSDLYHEI